MFYTLITKHKKKNEFVLINVKIFDFFIFGECSISTQFGKIKKYLE